MIHYCKTALSKVVQYFKQQYGFNNTDKNHNGDIKQKNATNTISFQLDQWNRFSILIRMENANNTSCEEFGKMLYLINEGRYDQKIVEILVDLGKNHKLPIDHIQQIMSGWAALLATEMDSDKSPCIKPTEVFNTK